MRKNLLAAAVSMLVVVSAVTAQTTTTKTNPGSAPDTFLGQPGGAFFALSVADVETVSRWYQEKLGFRVVKQAEAPNKIAKFALLEGGGTVIELVQHREAKTRAVGAPEVKDSHLLHGIFKIGLVVRDLDGVYREIKQRGVPLAYDIMQAKDIEMRSFIIRDAEGNMVQFFGK